MEAGPSRFLAGDPRSGPLEHGTAAMGPRTASTLVFLPLAALLAVSGCGGGPDTPVVSRDSAGVAITLSHTPAWTAESAWRLAAEPELVVGGIAGQRPYEFTTAGDARILDDGRLLVAHCSNPPELRLYGSDGRFLHNLAGPGSGPGQCNFILHSWLASDTVLVYDPSMARITYLPLDGGAARVLDLDAAGLGDVEGSAPLWVSRFADGHLLGRPNDPEPVADGQARIPFFYVALDPDAMTLDTILEARGTDHVVEGLGTAQVDDRGVLFSPFTHARAHGLNLYLADSEGFWIEEYARDGTLLRRFGRDWDPVEISRGFRRNYREQRVNAAPSSHRSAVRREMARAVFADHFPAHDGELLIDPGDNLWVGHLVTPEDTDRVWSVFRPDGRWLGEVHVPGPLRITDIGDDYVVGIWRDADGTQTIRRFAVLKPGG